MLGTPNVVFRAGDLQPKLEARRTHGDSDQLGLTAKRDLKRYYHALGVELRSVELSEAEASLIVDALNGWYAEPYTVQLLWAEVADAIRLDGLADKWHCDGDALTAKLQSLSYSQALAVVDATERFWIRNEAGESLAEQLRAVGLIG